MAFLKRFQFLIKIVFLNYVALGSGYLGLRHPYRFLITFCFFFLILASFIFGIPVDAYAQIPFYMLSAYWVLLSADALLLSVLTKKTDMVADWSLSRIVSMLILFCLQWSAVYGYFWLYDHSLVTTRLTYSSYPNMLPQMERKDLILVHAWAWREKKIGEKGLQKGDIIMTNERNQMIARRIVALPGDTLSVDAGKVRVNGVELAYEPIGPFFFPKNEGELAEGILNRETLPNGRSYQIIIRKHLPSHDRLVGGEFTIPEDCVGVLNDLRPVVMGKRYQSSFVICKDRIVARPIRIMISEKPENMNRLIE